MNFPGPHCPSVPYHSRWGTATGPTHLILTHPVSPFRRSLGTLSGAGGRHTLTYRLYSRIVWKIGDAFPPVESVVSRDRIRHKAKEVAIYLSFSIVPDCSAFRLCLIAFKPLAQYLRPGWLCRI